MKAPSRPVESYELARGVVAVAPGLAWLPATRTLVAADAHLAYEDVVGAALPLWSTAEIVETLALAAGRLAARELVCLGDVVHGAHMSAGALGAVRAGLAFLRTQTELVLVAGNHEGRSRGVGVLGATVEEIERDGWLLVHGDRPATPGKPAMIGHLHPSLHLGGGRCVPAFVASEALVVVPAMTPYSPGLDVLSQEFASALGRWSVRRRDAHVVAATGQRLYPFGSLGALAGALRRPAPVRPAARFLKRRLRPER